MDKRIKDKPTETATMRVEMRVVRDREHSAGGMFFKFADTTIEITDRETGEELATISGVVGGGIEIADLLTGKNWHISAQALWTAFTETLEVTHE
jgi:hypothetical protein